MDYSPKWGPNCTKYLPVMQCFFIYALLQPMSQASIFCHIKGLMKIHNRGKFDQYSICGCQVKIFSKFCKPIRHPWNGCFEFFVPLLPQIWSDFTEIFTRDSILADKNSTWIIFQKSEFLRKRDEPKICVFGPPFPLKSAEIERCIYFPLKKVGHQATQICQSQASTCSPLRMKNRITFLCFCTFWGKKQDAVKG